MRVVSVNIGQHRQVETPRGIVLTSIFKSPVEGRIPVRGHSLVGDTQSDLTVHGGPNKAVYGYPFEHYAYWTSQLKREITFGNFGENLTTEGLLESDIHVGDQYRIGTALLQVTKPRQPCYKLALRFELPTMVKLFWNSGFSGFYFSVVEEGDIAAGDPIELVKRNASGKTIAQVTQADREKAHS
jgi:MOSC domain-containing protein YiiM